MKYCRQFFLVKCRLFGPEKGCKRLRPKSFYTRWAWSSTTPFNVVGNRGCSPPLKIRLIYCILHQPIPMQNIDRLFTAAWQNISMWFLQTIKRPSPLWQLVIWHYRILYWFLSIIPYLICSIKRLFFWLLSLDSEIQFIPFLFLAYL